MGKTIKDEPKYYYERIDKSDRKAKDARKKRRQEIANKRKGLR